MRMPLPEHLPEWLPDYAPGRIVVVPEHDWPISDEVETTGVRTSIPRYALDVLTARVHIDPERVRWLTERVTTRPLESRHAHMTMHRGRLHLVDGHHALAAHLITGSDRVPVRLVRQRVRVAPEVTSMAPPVIDAAAVAAVNQDDGPGIDLSRVRQTAPVEGVQPA